MKLDLYWLTTSLNEIKSSGVKMQKLTREGVTYISVIDLQCVQSTLPKVAITSVNVCAIYFFITISAFFKLIFSGRKSDEY